MIKSEKQYKITLDKLKEFEDTLKNLNSNKTKDLLDSIMIDSILSQIETFKREISEYELLKNWNSNIIQSKIEELPKTLIKVRILKGLTQKQLAKKVGLKEQQIQRYEANNYESINFERLIQISNSMGLHFEETKARINCNTIPIKGIDEQLIQQATKKLHSRKKLLSI